MYKFWVPVLCCINCYYVAHGARIIKYEGLVMDLGS